MGTKGDSQPGEGSSAGTSSPGIPQRDPAVTAPPARQVGACVCCQDQANRLWWMSLPGSVGTTLPVVFSALQTLSSVLLPLLGSVCAVCYRSCKPSPGLTYIICSSTAHLNRLNCPKMPHIWIQKIRQKHIFYRFNPITFEGCMCIKGLVWFIILPSWFSSQKPGSKFWFLS